MHLTSSHEVQLLNQVLPHLVNAIDRGNSIAMFCPFCQVNGFKSNGKKWSQSERKGFLLNNNKNGYHHCIFYCHIDNCPSHALSTGGGGIGLQVFADYVLNKGHFIPSKPKKLDTVKRMGSLNKNPEKPVVERSQDVSKPKNVKVYPRPTRNQQNGLGAGLDRKIAARRNQRKNYWETEKWMNDDRV